MRPASNPHPEVPSTRFVFLPKVGFAILLVMLLRPAHPAAQPLNQVGRWAGPSDTLWGHMQIHMTLLPGDGTYHSKIISWGKGHATPTPASLWGWNPPTTTTQGDCSTYPENRFTRLSSYSGIPDLFCSGHSTLGNGDLLIAGGHEHVNEVGLRQSILFRPNALPGEQWIPQDNMAVGRW